MPDELHRIECRLLCRAVREACAYLGQGRYSAGYRCLLVHRCRVCEECDEPWAPDLVASYRAALFHYSGLYPAPHPLNPAVTANQGTPPAG